MGSCANVFHVNSFEELLKEELNISTKADSYNDQGDK